MDVQNNLLGQSSVGVVTVNADSVALPSKEFRNDNSDSKFAVSADENTASLAETKLNQRNAPQNLSQVLQNTPDNKDKAEDERLLSDAVFRVESFLQGQNRNLTFSIDENTARSVVTVLDSESGEVIRQIPSEELLVLAERIQELQQDVGSRIGVLIDKQV